jgi:uncharacterized protein YprB with RNaseH-like and TPR domain/predicted nucleic acid-binding protein
MERSAGKNDSPFEGGGDSPFPTAFISMLFFYRCLSVFIRGSRLCASVLLWPSRVPVVSAHDKFARVAALRPASAREAPPSHGEDVPPESDRLAQLLGARVRRNHFGEHLSLAQWYATPEMCVPDARSLILLLPKSPNTKEFLESAADPEQWLFLDTETTGLAGGTGTVAFLVGIAWWDAGGLQVEQFFMRDFDEEHSVLQELAGRMAKRPVLVTFNGKSFDWPLLETRYRMTRAIPSVSPTAHLDLLHPARQLWRLQLGSVRLKDLERHVLSSEGRTLEWSRHEDIDSALIPQFYFDYLRGGPVEPLAGIFRHNQMDLRGLAALAGKILGLLDSGNGIANAAHPSAHDPIELLGLSRILRRRGHSARARELYESALRSGLPRSFERLAQRELAQLAKRELDYGRATSLWEILRQKSAAVKRKKAVSAVEDTWKAVETAIEAAEQLAIYYEHRTKQPSRAAELILAAISELRNARIIGGIEPGRATKIETRLTRRLSRLERRCATGKAPKLL